MVRALREAWRVLRPGGLLIDLRPAIQHRRVSLRRAGAWRFVGVMRDRFDDDHAANRAVRAMVARRARGRAPLQFIGRTQIDCERVMDDLDDFRAWLADFHSRSDDLPPHDWLVARLARALAAAGPAGRRRVCVAGPLDLRVLRKGPAVKSPRRKRAKRRS